MGALWGSGPYRLNTGTTPDHPPARINLAPPGGSEMLTGPMDRDFRALWELLGALFVASCCFFLLSASFLLLRASFLLACELLGSKSEIPTGLWDLKNHGFSSRISIFREDLAFL